MILFFSGTGNSEYAAKRIGREIGDETVDLLPKIRRGDFTELSSASPWVIVAPTYAWRIPRPVRQWLERTNLSGNKKAYFVLTCGGNVGNAGKYIEKLCGERKLEYMGCKAVVMPENYIALFQTPGKEEAMEIIRQANRAIDESALLIKSNAAFPRPAISLQDKICSGIVNDAFYPLFVHARKFYATDACSSCGKCVRVCPLNNVALEDGKPKWGKNCTHCMACICRCPREAIEYGQHSKGLPRYVCPHIDS